MQNPASVNRGDESYIFVCYAHEDDAEVYPEIFALQQQGIRVWYDEGISPGHEWTQEIADAIDGADSLLYFISPNSVASRNCRNEIQYALSRDKTLVSVHLEPTDLPGGLELSIGLDQAILRYELEQLDYANKLAAALSSSTPRPNVDPVREASRSTTHRMWPIAVSLLVLLAIAGIWFYDDTEPIGTSSESVLTDSVPITAIAVLAFDDLSASQDQRWFSRGIAAELIESLGRIGALSVASWRSTETLNREESSVAAIGEALSVGSLVTGNVRRSGDRVTVVAEWTRVSDQSRLWTARYDRHIDEIIDVQRGIAIGIAEAIRTELGVDDATAGFFLNERYHTTDVRAWELAQRAWDIFQTWRPEERPAAQALAREALALDPNYAFVHGILAYYDVNNPSSRVSGALRALNLDPTNSFGHIILFEDSLANWDYETAEYILDRALRNHPSTSILYWEAMYLYSGTGRLEEALAAAKRAVQLDQLWPAWHWWYGVMLTNAGQPEKAIKALQEAKRLMALRGPGYQPFIYDAIATDLAYAFHKRGDEQAAKAASLETRIVPSDTLEQGWQEDGWRGYNRAYAAATEFGLANKCSLLARAERREEMYSCLDELMTSTTGPYQTRLEMNDRRIMPMDLLVGAEYAPYRSAPRLQAHITEIRTRMTKAARSYKLPAELR